MRKKMKKNDILMASRRELGDWLERKLGARFQYLWQVQDGQGRQSRDFRYLHPEEWKRWIEQGPCPDCPCRDHCAHVCTLRACWWDDRMEALRKRLGV